MNILSIKSLLFISLSLSLILLIGYSDKDAEIAPCESTYAMKAICGFNNPEDIANIPSSQFLIISQMGGFGSDSAGNVASFDIESQEKRILFPTPSAFPVKVKTSEPRVIKAEHTYWGQAACSPPKESEFRPHGLDLHLLETNQWRLAVVNHAQRDRIELFLVNDNDEGVSLEWKGCVLGAAEDNFNDIAGFSDGSFFVTHMFSKSQHLLGQVKSFLGFNTGYVLRWQGDQGFIKVRNSAGAFPNGLSLSKNGETLYVNYYMESKVKKIDWLAGEVLAESSIAYPDNSTWFDDNYLLVASHSGGVMSAAACSLFNKIKCRLSFEIRKVDVDTMASSVVIKSEGDAMEAATVGIRVGKQVFLGSFTGNRIAQVSFDNLL